MKHPFDAIKSKLLIGAKGLTTSASVKNMQTALSPANQLARFRGMYDAGINIRQYHDPLAKYLSRFQYINPYLRPRTK